MKAIYEFIVCDSQPGPIGAIICYAGGNKVMYDFVCFHGNFLLHATTLERLTARIQTLGPIYGNMWSLSPSIVPSCIPTTKQAYEEMCMQHDVERPGVWVD